LGRKSSLPFLYEKLLNLLEGDSEWGKTDTDRTNRVISLKYKLSKDDLEICMEELQKMDKITLKKSHNGPTSIFINRHKVS